MQAGEKEGAANGAEQEKDANCLKALWGQENPEERNGYRNRGARERLVEQKQPSATHGGRREGGRKEGQGDAREPGRASSRLLSSPRQKLAEKSFVRRKNCGCAGAFEEKKKPLSQLFPAVRLNPVQTYSRVNP